VRLALDTNRYSDFSRGNDATVETLETAEAVYLPFVVLGELRAGFAVGRHGWIAALVVQHSLVLCARDRHFDHLPQLPRV